MYLQRLRLADRVASWTTSRTRTVNRFWRVRLRAWLARMPALCDTGRDLVLPGTLYGLGFRQASSISDAVHDGDAE